MKRLSLSIIAIFIYSSLFAKHRIDTIDYWHVFYNKIIIAKYTSLNIDEPIKIKRSNVKTNDVLTVRYGDDTPCTDCEIALYIDDKKNSKKIILAKTKGTWSPMKVPVKDILNQAKLYHHNQIDLFYIDDRRDQLILHIKLE